MVIYIYASTQNKQCNKMKEKLEKIRMRSVHWVGMNMKWNIKLCWTETEHDSA